MQFKGIPIYWAEKVVPKGHYCYSILSVDHNQGKINIDCCPFWHIRKGQAEQANGFCSLLNKGDWELGFGLLWDQVKECDINYDCDEDTMNQYYVNDETINQHNTDDSTNVIAYPVKVKD